MEILCVSFTDTFSFTGKISHTRVSFVIVLNFLLGVVCYDKRLRVLSALFFDFM